jgi:hypothetical protein
MPCKCADLPLPWMLVKQEIAKDRMTRFNNNQGPILIKAGILGLKGAVLFYTAADFAAMWNYVSTGGNFNVPSVDALRICFAIYGAENTTDVPKGYGGKFTFLFAPDVVDTSGSNALYTDIGVFFTVLPTGGFNPTTCKIDAVTANQWMNNWENWVMQNLTVDPVPDNQDPVTGKYIDTRSVVYRADFFGQVITEINCQSAGGVNIYLVAYTESSGEPFPKRLTTQLTLADAQGNDLDVDLCNRPEPKGPKPFDGENLDTGNPCPPATGCP